MTLPRVSSCTPLYEQPRTPSASTLPLAMALGHPISHFLAALQPRKPRYRSTFLVLTVLMIFITYILVARTILSPHTLHLDPSATDQMTARLESIQNSHILGKLGSSRKHKPSYQKLQIKLDTAQELAAISSFLASLPQNHIPPSVDPSVPIDPQLVLDFGTHSSRAEDEVRAMVDDVWLQNPVFLYSKRYSSVSREIKAILVDMHLKPAPTIIDVDTRDDADVLTPILARLTSSSELPVLLIGGKYVGSIENIRDLHNSGDLRILITASGAVIEGTKRGKRRK